MVEMKNIHDIQIRILQKLLFAEGLKYSELRPYKTIENNQLSFHLNTLINEKLVEKEDALYFLTDAGKEYANRIGTDLELTLQAKVSVIFICFRNNRSEALLYRRLKHPFYGTQGFPSGKVKLGEKITEAVKRELKEETNLEGNPVLFRITHERVFHEDTKELLEDKIFFGFLVDDPIGELTALEEGELNWVDIAKISEYIDTPVTTLENILKYMHSAVEYNGGNPAFSEREHYTRSF